MGTAIAIAAVLASTVATLAAKKPDTPKLPAPEPPAELGDEGKRAALMKTEQRRRDMYAGGRPSTIKTSPLGLPGGKPASAQKLLTGQ